MGVIKNFKPRGGKHCITNALKQIFEYYDHPLSEEMMFGLGAGLDFIYMSIAGQPMVGGRTKIFEFEKTLAKRLNIQIKTRKSAKYENAFTKAKKMIDEDQPVLVYVDMAYLDYLGFSEDNHFGGHAVVMFGYDESENTFYVSDRDNSDYPVAIPESFMSEDYHKVPFEQIKRARSSKFRPFPAGNKYLEFDFNGMSPIAQDMLYESISDVCKAMLNPPVSFLGLSGIKKFSREILKWKAFDTEKLKQTGIMNNAYISERGGTGGGAFRKMYGQFLSEASEICNSSYIKQKGCEFVEIGQLWDNVADSMLELFETSDTKLLEKMSILIDDIHKAESHVLKDLQSFVKEKQS